LKAAPQVRVAISSTLDGRLPDNDSTASSGAAFWYGGAMSHRTSIALVLTVALTSAGCGTFQNVKRPCVPPPGNPDAPVCRIFGGVRSDWASMREYPLTQTTHYADYVVLPLMMAGDLVLVTVGDTVTLPYTAYEEVRRAYFPPDPSTEGSQPVPKGSLANKTKSNATPTTAATTPANGAPATGGQ
jgi:hypothetical protein